MSEAQKGTLFMFSSEFLSIFL